MTSLVLPALISIEYKISRKVLEEMGISEQDVVDQLLKNAETIKSAKSLDGRIFVETYKYGNFSVSYSEE